MAIKKLTGDLAQTSIGANVSFTATTTSGSTALTAVSSVVGLATGQTVTGAGIPVGTTITVSGSTVTLSVVATASGTGTVIAAAEQQVIGLKNWAIDVSLKTPDATTTDDSAWESFLPSSKTWSAKADYVFYDGDASQGTAILATINAPGVVTRWNFFPDPLNADVFFYGNAFIEKINFDAGTGKVIGLNVQLKGTGPLVQSTQTAPVANALTTTGTQAEG